MSEEKRDSASALRNFHVCEICGNKFFVPVRDLWVYKKHRHGGDYKWFCSYSCMTEFEKKQVVARYCRNCGRPLAVINIAGRPPIYCPDCIAERQYAQQRRYLERAKGKQEGQKKPKLTGHELYLKYHKGERREKCLQRSREYYWKHRDEILERRRAKRAEAKENGKKRLNEDNN